MVNSSNQKFETFKTKNDLLVTKLASNDIVLDIGRYIGFGPIRYDSMADIGLYIGQHVSTRYRPNIAFFSLDFFLDKLDLGQSFELYYAIIRNLRLGNVY